MTDTQLRALLKRIDGLFEDALPLLAKAGEEFVRRAKLQQGVDLWYATGWEEGGIECFCLHGGRRVFKDSRCGYRYEEKHIEPFFKGLKQLYYDSPFGLSRQHERY